MVPFSILVQIESWKCKGRELEAAKVQLKDLEAKVAQLQLVVSTLQTIFHLCFPKKDLAKPLTSNIK
jgi:hypothetical protein